jgi:DNA-binding NarL/FixJ family response regulator
VSAIARTLNLSAKTVSMYRTHILDKTGMPDDMALVRYAVRHGTAENDDSGYTG